MKPSRQPKILIYDIESLPNEGWFFDIFSDRGIPLAFVNRPKSICTIAYKWLGEKKAKVLVVDNPYEDRAILEAFMPIWEQADYTVAHFGNGFDYPFLAGRLMANGLPPLPTVTTVDTYKLAKKHFGRTLNSNKLDHLGEILGVGHKNKTDAMLWVRCAKGEAKAMKEMAAYNIQDVELLEKVLTGMLPYVNSTLNFNLFKDVEELICNQCGSNDLQKRGVSVTKLTKKQRYCCQSCGSWQVGKYEKELQQTPEAETKKPFSPARKKIASQNRKK